MEGLLTKEDKDEIFFLKFLVLEAKFFWPFKPMREKRRKHVGTCTHVNKNVS